jgi:hypothetical protein
MNSLAGTPWLSPPERLDAAGDRSVWLALVVALALLILPASPSGTTLVVLVALVATLIVATRWRAGGLAIVVLLLGGLVLRLAITNRVGSDVLDVTQAAIQRVLDGLNPYGIGYAASRPPGAPYPYGPVGFVLYLPVLDNPRQLELLSATVILTLLALRGRLLGLAIYAAGPTLIATSSDGSNDTTAGLLLLAVFAVAASRPRAAAVLLAVAIGFKPYIAAWLPAFLVWGGVWPAVAFVLASLAIWSPVLVVWGIPNFLASVQMADDVHTGTSWSLGSLYTSVTHHTAPKALFNNLRLVLGGLVALATVRAARSLDGVILGGTLVFLVTLFAGFWSTYAYFAAIAPILCWRIDDWLGVPARPLIPEASDS